MLHKFIVLALSLAVVFVGCHKENAPTIPNSNSTHKEVPSALMDQLDCMGADTTGAYMVGDHIVLEGDIAMTEAQLNYLSELRPSNPMGVSDRQQAVPEANAVTISNVADIVFFIDPSVATIPNYGQNWVNAIRTATANWTAISNCRVKYTETTNSTNPNIRLRFFRDNNPGLPAALRDLTPTDCSTGCVVAAACFPSGGQPGAFVSINDHPGPNELWGYQSLRESIMRHEIGHTLGLWHNNSPADAVDTNCNGAPLTNPTLINGTPLDDIFSIMRVGAYSLNFTANDLAAARYMFPDTYNTPVVNNYTISSNTSTTRLVTFNVNLPTPQVPYRVRILRRHPWSTTPVQEYIFDLPQSQTSFGVVSPTGTWNFIVQRENYGTFRMSTVPIQINVQ